MSKNILVQPAYFASIAQYAAILQADDITFEIHDNFLKQTYRTRCFIFAANGKLLLNVPVNKIKGQKTITANTEISYAEDWQKLHLKSLQSAYQNSPFFEYYEHDLAKIYNTHFTSLGELHQACHNFVMDTLQEKITTKTTSDYIINPNHLIDLRTWIDAKKDIDIHFSNYIQMFDDKHGFISNLSILDLIFMEGPSASIYLENLELNI